MKYLINRGGRLWEEKVDIEFVSKLDTYLDRGGAHRERKTKMLVETVCRGQCLWEGIHPFVPEWARSESVNQESNVLLAVGVSMSSVVDRTKFGVGVLLAIIA
jgi:hypothetical protein